MAKVKIGRPQCTMWKFHDFSITKILREINFRASRSPKSAVFAIFGALNFRFLKISALKKCKINKKTLFRDSKCVTIADFDTLHRFANFDFT